MSIEAMKQALEALEDVGVLTPREWQAVHKNKANDLRQAIAEAEKQEPVAYIRNDGHDEELIWDSEKDDDLDEFYHYQPLYTHPQPKREWVGLTDDDYQELLEVREWGVYLIEAVEAKLKEKNT